MAEKCTFKSLVARLKEKLAKAADCVDYHPLPDQIVALRCPLSCSPLRRCERARKENAKMAVEPEVARCPRCGMATVTKSGSTDRAWYCHHCELEFEPEDDGDIGYGDPAKIAAGRLDRERRKNGTKPNPRKTRY